MKMLRLIADDLTGALDSAAQFARSGRAIPVFLGHRLPAELPQEFAVDGGSRETDGAAAASSAARHAPLLAPGRGVICYRKVDSLLRGNPGCEIAATLRVISVGHCVIAPAFPFHGRATRGGLQHVRSEGSWRRVGEDIRATLEKQGMRVALMRPGDPVPAGISLWEAHSDEDLRSIVLSASELPEPVLWCGSGGLAAALSAPAGPYVPIARIRRPMLGIIGSDDPVTSAQLGPCGGIVLGLGDDAAANCPRVSAMLGAEGVSLVRFELPPGTGRTEASTRIARRIDELARGMSPPASLLAVGGETLRSLCISLGTDHLCVTGQVIPGVPVSRMVGGRWDGTEVVSKSGAFGDPELILRIASAGAV
jgi:D-threonate/D-erythronate kinase